MPFVTRKSLSWLAVLAFLGAASATGFIWSGLYNIGADDQHTRPVYAVLEALREQSIDRYASGIRVPDLTDPALVRQGAGNYAAMCAGCHRAPGVDQTELGRGLYPAPPALALGTPEDPARQFWVIKHGIKASGMPAWGKSMEDKYIWGMVALLQQLPRLSPEQYHELVEASGGHSHGGGEDHHEHGMEGEEHHEHGAEGDDHDHDHDAASPQPAPGTDAAKAAVAVVDRFGKALSSADFATVEQLLDPEVVILESGGAERSRDEYLGHHAIADAQFLQDAHVQVSRRAAHAQGDLAWVATESDLHASADGTPMALSSTETMVLRRVGDDWRIVHIHWSSRKKD